MLTGGAGSMAGASDEDSDDDAGFHPVPVAGGSEML